MLSWIHLLNLSLSCSTISLASQFIYNCSYRRGLLWLIYGAHWQKALRVDLVKFLSEIFSASFQSVFCDPGSQLSPCFTEVYLFTLVAWFHMIRLFQSSRNRKFATSVLRMVFKSLETFLNRFNFPTFMRCKVKKLEILFRPSHMFLWLSKT